MPKRVSQQTDADSYTWITDEFSSCSATCGGGSISKIDTVTAKYTANVINNRIAVVYTVLSMFSKFDPAIYGRYSCSGFDENLLINMLSI